MVILGFIVTLKNFVSDKDFYFPKHHIIICKNINNSSNILIFSVVSKVFAFDWFVSNSLTVPPTLPIPHSFLFHAIDLLEKPVICPKGQGVPHSGFGCCSLAVDVILCPQRPCKLVRGLKGNSAQVQPPPTSLPLSSCCLGFLFCRETHSPWLPQVIQLSQDRCAGSFNNPVLLAQRCQFGSP